MAKFRICLVFAACYCCVRRRCFASSEGWLTPTQRFRTKASCRDFGVLRYRYAFIVLDFGQYRLCIPISTILFDTRTRVCLQDIERVISVWHLLYASCNSNLDTRIDPRSMASSRQGRYRAIYRRYIRLFRPEVCSYSAYIYSHVAVRAVRN